MLTRRRDRSRARAAIVATQAERMLASMRAGGGTIPVPGRAKRHDVLDAAFLGGTAAHGIELDDGYRVGSAHLRLHGRAGRAQHRLRARRQRIRADRGCGRRIRGRDLPRASLRAADPPARLPSDQPWSARSARPWPSPSCAASRRNRSPTRSASRRARPLDCSRSSTAVPTSSGCTPARRARGHPGGAARRARRAGSAQRGRIARRLHAGFRVRRADKAKPIALPPDAEFGITDCYIKPYACCRHIQPPSRRCSGSSTPRTSRPTTSSTSTSRPIASPPSTRTPAGTTMRRRSSPSPT